MTANTKYWIGFDLGGTKMLATVYDQQFKALGRKRKKTKDGDTTAKGSVNRMIETMLEAIAEAKLTPAQIKGIGVGCPGPLDLDAGIVMEAPNLGWKNVHLKDILRNKFHCPVVIANDVDVGTYGEYRFGAGRGGRCVLGVFPGTGVGGGCVYEGRLIRGRVHSCMEIGHMHVQSNGRLCGCGRRGCLETVASRLAMASDAAVAVYRGEAPHLAKIAGPNLADIRSGTLAESIREGDAAVEIIVRNAAKQLGTAVSNVCNLLAPDVVILGGGLVEAMPKLFLEEVKTMVAKRVMKSLFKGIKIKVAELGDDAAVIGAAALGADAATASGKGL